MPSVPVCDITVESASACFVAGRRVGGFGSWGGFGVPSGADVHIMGMSHAEFGPWGIRREWVLIDETAIWKQILLKTG